MILYCLICWLPSVWQSLGPFMLLQMTLFCSFLWPVYTFYHYLLNLHGNTSWDLIEITPWIHRLIQGNDIIMILWKLFSRVRLFVTPWTYSPWNSPGKNTRVGSLSLLQGIFPTQGLNPGLPHCRQILYHLSHREAHSSHKHSSFI